MTTGVVTRHAILLADDEPMVRRLASRVLTEAGFDVLEAADGVEALEIFGRGVRIDLLLTDVQMPRGDGVMLSAAVRRDYPHLPILYMSAHPLGVYDLAPFIPKPFDFGALIAQVRDLLASKATDGAAVPSAGDQQRTAD
jgi:two-component system, cell cycle sensor histidine kinase and response regulator CckA